MTTARGSGNRCGHDPANPRRRLTVRGKPPKLIARMMSAVSKYFERPGLLPELEDPRSERREAIGLVLQSMLLHTSLIDERIGFPTKSADGWVGLPRKQREDDERHRAICGETGCNVSRVDRAIDQLETCGYIVTDGQPREEKANGEWTGRPARRRITRKLKERLGVVVAWEIESKRAYSRHRDARRLARLHESDKQRRRRERREGIRDPRLAAALELAPTEEGPPAPWPEREEPTDPGRPRRAETPPPVSRYDRLSREIEREHPDWGPVQVWEELQRRLAEG